MPLKDFDQLSAEINAAVHTNGPQGKTTAAGLSNLLKSLATELTILPRETALATARKADLDASGRVPSSQLPGYVDDVVEAATFEALPSSGEAGKLYVSLATNTVYRWSGSQYISLANAELTVNQLAALTAAPLLSGTNPVAARSDLTALAELRRTDGSIQFFATAEAAIAAAADHDTVVLRGVHPEVNVAKTLHVIAYGATLAGVVLSWRDFSTGLRSTWRGGLVMGRFFVGRSRVEGFPNKCQAYDVEFGPAAYIQAHTNNTQHNGVADEYSFYNCRITHVLFHQRLEDVYNQRQSLYFSNCSWVPTTPGAVFRGPMYRQSTLAAHNCRFQPQPGHALFDSPTTLGKLWLHGLSTVPLAPEITNFLVDGLQVVQNADPFVFPPTPERLAQVTGGGTFSSLTGQPTDNVLLADALAKKVDKVLGKELSSNDYTTAEKAKLAALVLGGSLRSINGILPDAEGNVSLPPATMIRTNTTDPPASVPAAHNVHDVWLNSLSGNLYTLSSTRVYTLVGSLKGPAANAVLVAFADNANGDNPSSSPIGKKFRAEYTPAATDPAPTVFDPGKATGRWVPFSNQRLSGTYTGTVLDLNIDSQTAADYSGVWTINELTNVYAGASVRLERKSLNTTYAPGTGTLTVSSPLTVFTTSAPHGRGPGDTVRVAGQIRRVAGANSTTTFITTAALSAAVTDVSWEKLVPDTLVLAGSPLTTATVTGSMLVNGVVGAVVTFSVYGVFLPGYTNVLRLQCVAVTGTGNARAYKFDLMISN